MFILSIIPTPLPRSSDNKNPTQRLSEIRSRIVVAEQRVRDLEALLTELILQSGPTDPISGLDEADPQKNDANQIRQELYRARAYEGELRTAEQFWNNIVQSNKEAEKDTHDLFKKA